MLDKMADFRVPRALVRSGARDLANRWFQPLTHVSGGGFPRDCAALGQRGKREMREGQRFAAAQRAAHSVHGRFA